MSENERLKIPHPDDLPPVARPYDMEKTNPEEAVAYAMALHAVGRHDEAFALEREVNAATRKFVNDFLKETFQ